VGSLNFYEIILLSSFVIGLVHLPLLTKRVPFIDKLPKPMVIFIAFIVISNLFLSDNTVQAYRDSNRFIFPAVLFLLLVDIEYGSFLKSSKALLVLTLSGVLALVVAAPVATFLFAKNVPDAWGVIGMTVAGWTGGTINIAAVKEMLAGDLQDVNTAFGIAMTAALPIHFAWMSGLMFVASTARKIEAPSEFTDRSGTDDNQRTPSRSFRPFEAWVLIFAMACSIVVAKLFANILGIYFVGDYLPEIEFITVSLIAVCLSFSKLRQFSILKPLGSVLFLFYIAGAGAQSQLEGVAASVTWYFPILATLLVMHGLTLLLVSRLLGLGLGEAAIASASTIGGFATAPAIASCYDPRLVPVSVGLAAFGSALGTWTGLAAALLSR
jgi:uncharacterized membrane protein